MQDKRTIILAVLPSNVDVATREIIALAEKYDKLGERTLGVLTKPDLVTEASAKISVCTSVSQPSLTPSTFSKEKKPSAVGVCNVQLADGGLLMVLPEEERGGVDGNPYRS